jgi:hypothetical protein
MHSATHMKKLLAALLFLLATLGNMSCSSPSLGVALRLAFFRQIRGDVYLKHNLHYRTRRRGSYKVANIDHYLTAGNGIFLPYNTKVSIGRDKEGFKLKIVKTGDVILVHAPKRYLGLTTLEEYLDLILSPEPMDYTDLPEIDKKGILSGQPREGMSKKGIMIALGYPAPAFTQSLEADIWHYWNNRFSKCEVYFKDDIVERVR